MVTSFTREYSNSSVAQRDIARQTAAGYEVVSMTNIEQSAGVGRWLILGWASLIFKPKPHVLVVYKYTGSDPQNAKPVGATRTPEENMAAARASMAEARENWARTTAAFRKKKSS